MKYLFEGLKVFTVIRYIVTLLYKGLLQFSDENYRLFQTGIFLATEGGSLLKVSIPFWVLTLYFALYFAIKCFRRKKLRIIYINCSD